MADPPARCGNDADTPDAAGHAEDRVATARKPATYCVQNPASDAEALEITARPIAADPTSSYLIQVFLDGGAKEEKPKLIGSFSFLPPRVGRSETFVLPNPNSAETAGSDLRLFLKLIPANAAKPLEKAAVEVVSARLVK